MSILPLAALPAATSVARDAVKGGAEVGKSFFNMLAGLTNSGNTTSAEEAVAKSAGASANDEQSNEPLTQRTASFSNRLANWLRQQSWFQQARQDNQPLTIQFSLDPLDQPHATIDGQSSAELDEALANNPSWLQEFRDLALDRIEQLGAQGSAMLPGLSIKQATATDAVDPTWS